MSFDDLEVDDLTSEPEEYGRSALQAWTDEAKDRHIYKPKPNELLIDIDSEQQWEAFQNRVNQLDGIVSMEVRASVKPNHKHIIVTLDKDITDWQRLALQAVLGDPLRGFLDILKLNNTGETDTCLFLVNERK